MPILLYAEKRENWLDLLLYIGIGFFEETLLKEFTSLHIDCSGLFRERCPHITGFN